MTLATHTHRDKTLPRVDMMMMMVIIMMIIIMKVMINNDDDNNDGDNNEASGEMILVKHTHNRDKSISRVDIMMMMMMMISTNSEETTRANFRSHKFIKKS